MGNVKESIGNRNFARILVSLAVFIFPGCIVPYSDRVNVTIRQLPPTTQFACVVADTPEGVRPMWWLFHKVFTVPGQVCSTIGQLRRDDVDAFRREVIWVCGDRVGVVFREADKRWQVAWFSGPHTWRRGRIPLLDGGSWECDFNKADMIEPLSKEHWKLLGLDKWPDDES